MKKTMLTITFAKDSTGSDTRKSAVPKKLEVFRRQALDKRKGFGAIISSTKKSLEQRTNQVQAVARNSGAVDMSSVNIGGAHIANERKFNKIKPNVWPKSKHCNRRGTTRFCYNEEVDFVQHTKNIRRGQTS